MFGLFHYKRRLCRPCLFFHQSDYSIVRVLSRTAISYTKRATMHFSSALLCAAICAGGVNALAAAEWKTSSSTSSKKWTTSTSSKHLTTSTSSKHSTTTSTHKTTTATKTTSSTSKHSSATCTPTLGTVSIKPIVPHHQRPTTLIQLYRTL